MRELGLGGLAVTCCVGLPLAAAALSATALAWIGGGLVGLALLAVAVAVAVHHGRRRREVGLGPLVEILYFDGCPNHDGAVALVERVAAELGLRPEIRLVNVPDEKTASRVRFLGSPTVRISGRDVEPRAEERTDFGLSCRVFRTERGLAGQPEEALIRDALRSAARPIESAARV